jgi:hypothetical protein
MMEYDLDHGMIITRDEEEEIDVDEYSITIMPAWKFLLK